MTIELAKYNFIGSKIDVTGTDQGSKQLHMDHMKDIYETIYGHKDINSMATITGKSPEKGGMKNHNQALGASIYYCITNIIQNKAFEEIRKKLDLDQNLHDKKIIMVGFGEMGKNAA